MSPSVNHSYIQLAVGATFFNMKKYSVYTELSIEIEGKEYVPDICVYEKSELNQLHDILRMKEMPLLAIEILSPTQIIQDLTDKIEIYLNAEIQSCWLVIPIVRTVVVFNKSKKPISFSQDEVIDEKLNISIPLNEIFPF